MIILGKVWHYNESEVGGANGSGDIETFSWLGLRALFSLSLSLSLSLSPSSYSTTNTGVPFLPRSSFVIILSGRRPLPPSLVRLPTQPNQQPILKSLYGAVCGGFRGDPASELVGYQEEEAFFPPSSSLFTGVKDFLLPPPLLPSFPPRQTTFVIKA